MPSVIVDPDKHRRAYRIHVALTAWVGLAFGGLGVTCAWKIYIALRDAVPFAGAVILLAGIAGACATTVAVAQLIACFRRSERARFLANGFAYLAVLVAAGWMILASGGSDDRAVALWGAGILAVVLSLLAMIWSNREFGFLDRQARLESTACRKCGYDLRVTEDRWGALHGRCPECGTR